MSCKRSAIAFAAWSAFGVSVATMCAAQQPQYPDYPSETPEHFKPATTGWDYARREAMIPMRDGVKLHAVILVPKGAKNAPILLTRTPYSADGQTQQFSQRAPGAGALRIRQRDGCDCGGRVHPRGGGHSGQVRLGGRLRDEPAAAWAAESDAGG